MSFDFRVFEEGDLPECLGLWTNDAGWGELTADQWRQWFVDTPDGPAMVILATESTGQIVGQFFLMPMSIQIGEIERLGWRMKAPVISKKYRRMQLRDYGHPIIGLLKKAIEVARQGGAAIMFTLPARGWLSFFQWAAKVGVTNFELAEFGCCSKDMRQPVKVDTSPGEFTCEPIQRFGEQFSQLWAASRENLPIHCGIVRSPRVLSYRNGDHVNLQVLNYGELIGYLSLNKKTGLIEDLLAREERYFQHVIQQSIDYLQRQRLDLNPVTQIKLLELPMLSQTIHDIRFQRDKYRFSFACLKLDPGLDANEIRPELWYLTGGD